MKIADFTSQPYQALLDLLVMGMYADGYLAVAEDEHLHQLLAMMGFETRFDRNRQLDAAVTRIRRHVQSAEATRAHAGRLARSFTTAEQRREVCGLLEGLMASDNQVTPSEGQFVSVVRELFQL